MQDTTSPRLATTPHSDLVMSQLCFEQPTHVIFLGASWETRDELSGMKFHKKLKK